jgi:hypothetical protein
MQGGCGIGHLKWFQNVRLGSRARRGPIRRRLKSYGGTGEKAQSRLRRDEQYILKRFAIRQRSLAD